MSKKKNEISFEESLERLENLVNKMESGDATLEQSLVWFEEGMDLIKLCQVQLNNAEQKVQELVKKTDGKLELKDIKLENPKANEVLIKHTAIGLNYIDTYHRSGLYPVPLPSGIGLEGAGIIEKVGTDTDGFKEGDSGD